MNVNELILLAISNMPNKRVDEFCSAMNVNDATLYYWRKGKSIPSPEHAHKLAVLAGVDPRIVVADVLIQSTKDTELKATYSKFKSLVAALVGVAVCILCQIDLNQLSSRFIRTRTLSYSPI